MDTQESPKDTDVCEGCKKPAPLGKSGLYFCARCRRAWMPARKQA